VHRGHAQDAADFLTSKLQIMEDVVCGMAFLSALNVVHRDLAARNVLVDASNICKVGGIIGLAIELCSCC
jgi:Ser/Thr protein kinase RdoA (MazF antagonist)